MAVKCPNCHSENPDTSRFCGNCAAALAQAGQPPVLTKTLETPAYVLTKGSLIAGKYRITEEIGRGGMGVVYEAEDTKLARKVAVKVLPEAFTADRERLARFEREARVLASLNHPNIAAIYGLEEADGKRFLILELVEGENLADRLSRGALTYEETLEVCRQIADGLEGAHEKGIIHRDLKPSNVKITPDRKVKILDFGLAKALHDQTSEVDISKSPTITADMTQPGVILGTAAYMSPEQATGRPVDKRADIWAFGCILYECLAGKRAFSGAAVTETIAAILRGEPDWDSLPVDTPGNVRAVMHRCLQKDPRERLRDIGDARLEMAAPVAYPSQAFPARRRFPLAWLVVSAAVALFAGIIIGRAFIKHPQSALRPPAVKSTIKVEPGYWLDGARRSWEMEHPSRTAMAISSDGSFVVYCAIEENPGLRATPRLFLRRLDQSEAKPIAGTEGAYNPFLSPDNRWVGFGVEGQFQLKKVPVEGGVPSTLCDSDVSFGANWGRDNTIVFAPGTTDGLFRVPAQGGKPETLTKPDPKREEWSHRLPFCLPDGKAVLFTVMRHGSDRHPWLCLLRLDTREWNVLLPDAADARYVPTGHLVFLRQGTLMAVRFDLARLEIIGQPVALVENVMQAFSVGSWFNTGVGQFGISDTGALIYAAGGIVPDAMGSLLWVDQRGTEQPVTDLRFPFFAPRLSPDGQRIAYGTMGREWQVWVYDLGRGTNNPLTGEGRAEYPVWSPDGKRLVFSWHKSLAENLFWQLFDGSAPMERLTTSEYTQYPGSWSPDGKTVALTEYRQPYSLDIALLDVRSGRMSPFLNSPDFAELYPEFSPDGRWIAYSSNESKRPEIYVRPFPGPGTKYPVSSGGGLMPAWARNGKQLFWLWEEGQMWVADIRTEGGFAAGKPRLLIEKWKFDCGSLNRTYDLSLDSQRFLTVGGEGRKISPVTEIVLVQNWLEELNRLVPAGKK